MVLSSWVELVEHCKQCKSSTAGWFEGDANPLHIAWYCECVYDGFGHTTACVHVHVYIICGHE